MTRSDITTTLANQLPQINFADRAGWWLKLNFSPASRFLFANSAVEVFIIFWRKQKPFAAEYAEVLQPKFAENLGLSYYPRL
jgi:hypothetical protein